MRYTRDNYERLDSDHHRDHGRGDQAEQVGRDFDVILQQRKPDDAQHFGRQDTQTGRRRQLP